MNDRPKMVTELRNVGSPYPEMPVNPLSVKAQLDLQGKALDELATQLRGLAANLQPVLAGDPCIGPSPNAKDSQPICEVTGKLRQANEKISELMVFVNSIQANLNLS